jgi:hypothetical protein
MLLLTSSIPLYSLLLLNSGIKLNHLPSGFYIVINSCGMHLRRRKKP